MPFIAISFDTRRHCALGIAVAAFFLGYLDGGLRNLNLPCASCSGKIYWLMDAREVGLGRGCNRIQPGNIRLVLS